MGVGHLLKRPGCRGEEFFDVLRCVADGGTVVDPEVVRQLLRRRRVPLERLATREREVLALIAEGESSGATARELVWKPGAGTCPTGIAVPDGGILPIVQGGEVTLDQVGADHAVQGLCRAGPVRVVRQQLLDGALRQFLGQLGRLGEPVLPELDLSNASIG